MRYLIYLSAVFSTICLLLYFVFEMLRWPSFFFSYMMLAIIFFIIWIGLIIFGKVKNKIGRIILSFSVIVSIITTIGVFEISRIFQNSEPYLLTIESLRSNEFIVSNVGADFEEGMIMGGNLGENHSFFSFSIKGHGKKVKVYSTVKKNSNGDWEIVEIKFE